MRHLTNVINARWFDRLVIVIILCNAVTLSLETYDGVTQRFGTVLHVLDSLFIWFFIGELCLRLIVYQRAFFSDGWRWFDLIIVVLTTLPLLGISALGNVSAFRALRLLRLLSVIPAFRTVFAGIARALRDSAAVMGVLGVLLGIFAIVASSLFGEIDPEHFGDLHTAMFTLFQIMTLDAWSDVVRPLMQVSVKAAIFFVTFIVIVVFILLSTIIGIAANAMNTSRN